MKFKFCGGLDVPEWLLTEFAVLSKLSCVRVLLLTREIASDLTGGKINNQKLLKLTHGVVERSSVKAIVASLRYVLANAAKYDIASQELVPELSQLGLPSENCSAIAKPYEANRTRIAAKLRETSLRLPGISSVDWRADCILGSSFSSDLVAPAVQLRLNLSEGGGGGEFGTTASNFCFELDDATFSLFRSEMRSALNLLERA